MTPMLEAQNISGLQKEQPLLLLEENLEQLSIGNEEEYGCTTLDGLKKAVSEGDDLVS